MAGTDIINKESPNSVGDTRPRANEPNKLLIVMFPFLPSCFKLDPYFQAPRLISIALSAMNGDTT
jgi:hypothetical protein